MIAVMDPGSFSAELERRNVYEVAPKKRASHRPPLPPNSSPRSENRNLFGVSGKRIRFARSPKVPTSIVSRLRCHRPSPMTSSSCHLPAPNYDLYPPISAAILRVMKCSWPRSFSPSTGFDKPVPGSLTLRDDTTTLPLLHSRRRAGALHSHQSPGPCRF